MSKTIKAKSLLIMLVLVISLVPMLVSAGSWYTFSSSGSGTNYNTPTFENSGQPNITVSFSSSSSYRTYTIKLQRLTLSGTWEDVDQTSGSINANSTTPVSYTSYITNRALNTYRYNITISASSSFNYTIKYYK